MMGAPRGLVQRVHAGAGSVFGLLLFVILLSGAWSMAHEDLRGWLLLFTPCVLWGGGS